MHPQKDFMDVAIREAEKARQRGDYAIGAVVVRNGAVVGRGGQRIKTEQDPIQHAEIVAIREACRAIGSRFLEGCLLYTTHEPCPMCASAAVWARMEGVVYGSTMEDMLAYATTHGNKEWTWRTIKVPASTILEHGEPKLFVIKEFMRDQCKKLFHV